MCTPMMHASRGIEFGYEHQAVTVLKQTNRIISLCTIFKLTTIA